MSVLDYENMTEEQYEVLEKAKTSILWAVWALRAAVGLDSSAEHIEQLWAELRASVEAEHQLHLQLEEVK